MIRLSRRKNEDGTAPETDADLMIRVRKGDSDALEEIFHRHSKLVYSVALRVLQDPRLAEDLLQEIFMQLWHKPINDIKLNGSLPALLAVMTRHRCIDQIRTQKTTVDLESVELASSFNLARNSEDRLLVEKIRSQANSLPSEQRQVLELAFFEGMTHSEIAEKTKLPLGTIKTRIRSAIQRLTKEVAG